MKPQIILGNGFPGSRKSTVLKKLYDIGINGIDCSSDLEKLGKINPLIFELLTTYKSAGKFIPDSSMEAIFNVYMLPKIISIIRSEGKIAVFGIPRTIVQAIHVMRSLRQEDFKVINLECHVSEGECRNAIRQRSIAENREDDISSIVDVRFNEAKETLVPLRRSLADLCDETVIHDCTDIRETFPDLISKLSRHVEIGSIT